MAISPELEELTVDIDSLTPREGNPRQGNLETIKESLEVNGQYRPIVVNKRDNEILAGNHTWQAAKALGWNQIAVTYVDVDEDQAARIVLIDNRANDVAEYDNEALLKILNELDDLKGTGFSNASVSDLLRAVGTEVIEEGNADPDDVPDEPESEEVQTKAGDIWQLGPHRLICGDSTDQVVIERLMDGRQADLLLTDPPYGVSYEEKTKDQNEYARWLKKHGRKGSDTANEGKIENDKLSDAEINEFIDKAYLSASNALASGCPVYSFTPQGPDHHVFGALFKKHFKHAQILIWVKSIFVFGRQDYHWQHEPILYGWKEGAAHKWFGAFDKTTTIDDRQALNSLSKQELLEIVQQVVENTPSSVIDHQKQTSNRLHPTTKPVGLLEPLIQNSSQIGDAVLDIFAGSGSTLIACQRTGRAGYMVELDPAYCDVIVKRWEDYTGEKAQKV